MARRLALLLLVVAAPVALSHRSCQLNLDWLSQMFPGVITSCSKKLNDHSKPGGAVPSCWAGQSEN